MTTMRCFVSFLAIAKDNELDALLELSLEDLVVSVASIHGATKKQTKEKERLVTLAHQLLMNLTMRLKRLPPC